MVSAHRLFGGGYRLRPPVHGRGYARVRNCPLGIARRRSVKIDLRDHDSPAPEQRSFATPWEISGTAIFRLRRLACDKCGWLDEERFSKCFSEVQCYASVRLEISFCQIRFGMMWVPTLSSGYTIFEQFVGRMPPFCGIPRERAQADGSCLPRCVLNYLRMFEAWFWSARPTGCLPVASANFSTVFKFGGDAVTPCRVARSRRDIARAAISCAGMIAVAGRGPCSSAQGQPGA
jgi:hypothetical protein